MFISRFRKHELVLVMALLRFIILTGGLHVNGQNQNFYNLTLSDGLSHHKITCIGQDRYGFVWIGTPNGINIYDGTQIRVLKSKAKDAETIPNNSITSFYFDEDSVWIGTYSGFCVMSIKTNIVRRVEEKSIPNVLVLHKDSRLPILWIGTKNGLVKFDLINQNIVERYNTNNSNISHNIVHTIFQDTNGNLWIGTADKLNKLAPNSSVFKTFDLKNGYLPEIKNNLVLRIKPFHEQNDSLLWIGTQTGLVLFNRITENPRFFRVENSQIINSSIKCIHTTTSGTHWFGTDFGLIEMDNQFNIKTYLHYPGDDKSLINNMVWEIFEDHSGTLWFGTDNGISILNLGQNNFLFNPILFSLSDHISGYDVLNIFQDSNDDLWLSTPNGALHYQIDNGIIEKFDSYREGKKRITDRKVNRIIEDSNGQIWMGTNGGLYIWSPFSERMRYFTADDMLRSNFIVDMIEVSSDTFLINTTVAGLHLMHLKNNQEKFSYIGNFGSNRLFVRKDYIYTYRETEIIKIDLKDFSTFTEKIFTIRGEDRMIHSMHFVDDTTIWLGVLNGLIEYNTISKSFDFFEIKSDKDIPIINLLSDNQGNIWASSYSAIFRLVKNAKEIEIFSRENSIIRNIFNRGSCLKCTNGDLIFGVQNGIIHFNPDKIAKSDYDPPVVLTNMSIQNNVNYREAKNTHHELIPFIRELTLKYDQRSFSINFSSLHFGDRNGIQYAYKLEGVDTDWNYIIDSEGTATYTNINPGEYNLIVRGTNIDGVWSPHEANLKIKIRPFLWASNLFLFIYFILFTSVVILITKYWMNRIQLKNELNRIKDQNVSSEAINRNHQHMISSIIREYVTPLSLIAGSAERLVKNGSIDNKEKRFARIIENNSKRLFQLYHLLNDIIKPEKSEKNIDVQGIDLIQLIKDILLLFRKKADNKNIECEFHTVYSYLTAKIDAQSLEAVLFNFFSYAFDALFVKGKITISVKCISDAVERRLLGISSVESECVIIEIQLDDGGSVAQQYLQPDDPHKDGHSANFDYLMVKNYLQILNGKIDAQTIDNSASQIRIFLPYHTVSSEVLDNNTIDSVYRQTTKEDLLPDSRVKYDLGKPLILLVENSWEVSEFLALYFKRGFSVIIVRDEQEASVQLKKHLPDFIIYSTKEISEFTLSFLQQIRSNNKTASVFFILLLDIKNQDGLRQGYENGADIILYKPVDYELLKIRMENHYKSKRRLIEFQRIEASVKPKIKSLVSQDEKLFGKIVNIIEKHISEPDLNAHRISEETGLSYSIITRITKSFAGETLVRLVQTIRMNHAAELLKSKKFSIAEVMDYTGFVDPSYFSKCFKRQFKQSPKEFADNHDMG